MLLLLLPMLLSAWPTGAQQKVFRYAFPVAETGFDPVQVSDLYSGTLIHQMFDPPLTYDFLARPSKVVPNVADMPEITDEGKTFTLRVRPGIYFADDPAFNGKRRELTAQDFVYSVKRQYDPKWKSPNLYLFEHYLIGMDEVRAAAVAGGRFDYDREVEGIRALDRYTLRIRLSKPNWTFIHYFTYCNIFCAVAREVVEHYGDKIAEHPVGTGPYRLTFWKRSSKMVFEKNPDYREDVFAAQAPPDDPALQATMARMAGKRMPRVDRVEVAIIEEPQPRWLAFLNGEHDFLERLPNDFANVAVPNNKLAPNLKKRGIVMEQNPLVDVTYTYFQMENPVVGGYTPEKVALRRAILLAYDRLGEIQIARKNQAIPAYSVVGPNVAGYDPSFRTSATDYDPARARALLDAYGYVDRNGDGCRDLPDGKPLRLEYASQPDQNSKPLQEVWKKSMTAVGLCIDFKLAKWPEQLKASKAGKLMMWGLGWSAAIPDADSFFVVLYGPNGGQANHSRFRLPAFDALYDRAKLLPDGPERNAIYREMMRVANAYAPLALGSHRIATDMWYPSLVGYHRHPVLRTFWKYLDIDASRPQLASQ